MCGGTWPPQAASAEGRAIPWAVDTASPTFGALRDLMVECLASDRDTRPAIGTVIDRLRELREALRRGSAVPPSS